MVALYTWYLCSSAVSARATRKGGHIEGWLEQIWPSLRTGRGQRWPYNYTTWSVHTRHRGTKIHLSHFCLALHGTHLLPTFNHELKLWFSPWLDVGVPSIKPLKALSESNTATPSCPPPKAFWTVQRNQQEAQMHQHRALNLLRKRSKETQQGKNWIKQDLHQNPSMVWWVPKHNHIRFRTAQASSSAWPWIYITGNVYVLKNIWSRLRQLRALPSKKVTPNFRTHLALGCSCFSLQKPFVLVLIHKRQGPGAQSCRDSRHKLLQLKQPQRMPKTYSLHSRFLWKIHEK